MIHIDNMLVMLKKIHSNYRHNNDKTPCIYSVHIYIKDYNRN